MFVQIKSIMFSMKTAGPEDRFLINDLASRVWGNTYGEILSKEQLDYMFHMMYDPESILKQINELHHQYFIAYSDGVPSGYISIEPKEDNIYYFQKIYALPETQGTGLGRYMVEYGINYLKEKHAGPFTIMLNVNRENQAIGFYEHLGFQVSATRDHDIGNGYYMNDYIMSLPVNY